MGHGVCPRVPFLSAEFLDQTVESVDLQCCFSGLEFFDDLLFLVEFGAGLFNDLVLAFLRNDDDTIAVTIDRISDLYPRILSMFKDTRSLRRSSCTSSRCPAATIWPRTVSGALSFAPRRFRPSRIPGSSLFILSTARGPPDLQGCTIKKADT